MTAGGRQGTNGVGGPSLHLPGVLWWLYAGCLLIVAAVTATSFWIEAQRFGQAADLICLAVIEATSVVVIFVLTWPLVRWTQILAPGRVAWSTIIAGHFAGFLAFALLHVGGMMTLRWLVFGLLGWPWSMQPVSTVMLYELRKDALVYVGLVLVVLLLRRAFSRAERAAATVPPRQAEALSEAAPARLEIRDGSRRFRVESTEILWVEAAGNYVQLHAADREILWRRTLASVEAELTGHGFQRIHRSRLVNLRHIRSAATNDNGDFTVTLSTGTMVGGARRWRQAFDAATARRSVVDPG